MSATAACAPAVSVGVWMMVFKLAMTWSPKTALRSSTAQVNASVANPSMLPSLVRVASWHGSSWALRRAAAACVPRSSESRLKATFRKLLTATTSAFHWLMESWTSLCEGVVLVSRMQGRSWRARREEAAAVEARARVVKKDFMIGRWFELMVLELVLM